MSQLAQAAAPAKGEKLVYTAKTHTTGGRAGGTSHSSDGRLDIKLSIPGAPGTGTNPEQLFAAGWSACFEGAMAIVAHKKKISLPADTAIDAEVDLNLNLAAGTYFLRARLNVSVPGVDRELAQAIVERSAPGMPVLPGNSRQHRRDDQSCLNASVALRRSCVVGHANNTASGHHAIKYSERFARNGAPCLVQGS